MTRNGLSITMTSCMFLRVSGTFFAVIIFVQSEYLRLLSIPYRREYSYYSMDTRRVTF